jgi:type II secretory pathway pseudopilin PulG
MFIKPGFKLSQAWTLVEMMVAVAIFSVATAALCTLFMFSMRSFASLANYAALDQQNRHAMDVLTKELREAIEITDYQTNATTATLTLLNGETQNVSYTFTLASKQMVRQANGQSQVLLTNCALLQFHLFERTPSNGNYNFFPVATNNWQKTVKLVELTWKTSKALNPTTRINSENVQTARIVIRKQQDN